MEKRRLERIEEHIFTLFRARGAGRLLARYTKVGNDRVSLTAGGAALAGLAPPDDEETREAFPHPPRSSTG